jgi:hypothetical protein
MGVTRRLKKTRGLVRALQPQHRVRGMRRARRRQSEMVYHPVLQLSGAMAKRARQPKVSSAPLAAGLSGRIGLIRIRNAGADPCDRFLQHS